MQRTVIGRGFKEQIQTISGAVEALWFKSGYKSCSMILGLITCAYCETMNERVHDATINSVFDLGHVSGTRLILYQSQ